MKTGTGWVKLPRLVKGQDHLGSQAPCINLYGRLLPGITNVTDRARYYSFYPWFFWAYEKEFTSLNWEKVVAFFRRADCLFTLIAARHANQTDKDRDNHGVAMAGRETLLIALSDLENGKPLFLSTYATEEKEDPNRYFKSKLGGLGQYYIGTLKELGILDGNSISGVRYIRQRAEKIAEAMDLGVPRKLFFETVKADEVTTKRLDALKSFCPCHLLESLNEREALTDLFFDRDSIFGDEGVQRRLTLQLLLHLINELESRENKEEVVCDHFLFRSAVYTGYLGKNRKWALPETLESTRNAWAIYQRNEIISVACQSIFWVVLRVIEETTSLFYTSGEFADYFLRSESVLMALGEQKDSKFKQAVTDVKEIMPNIGKWEDQKHECFLAQQVVKNCSKRRSIGPYDDIIKSAIDIIILLAARNPPNSKPYGNFEFHDNYFNYYPINLYTLYDHITGRWQDLTLQSLLGWLVSNWCIETHFRVALRKLHRDKTNTFKIRPTDEGLEVTQITEPVFTTPRFKQGIRILRDIGAITLGNKQSVYRLTDLGRDLLEGVIGD